MEKRLLKLNQTFAMQSRRVEQFDGSSVLVSPCKKTTNNIVGLNDTVIENIFKKLELLIQEKYGDIFSLDKVILALLAIIGQNRWCFAKTNYTAVVSTTDGNLISLSESELRSILYSVLEDGKTISINKFLGYIYHDIGLMCIFLQAPGYLSRLLLSEHSGLTLIERSHLTDDNIIMASSFHKENELIVEGVFKTWLEENHAVRLSKKFLKSLNSSE